MTEPKFKLGDDGELEEIIEDFDEKPKRKSKSFNRTLYIPMTLMLALVASVILLIFTTFWISRPAVQPIQQYSTQIFYTLEPLGTPKATFQLYPSETPGGYLDHLPLCGLLPITQKPRFVYSADLYTSDLELLRIDADGTNSCRLTTNNTPDSEPSWSPDGNRIAFTAFYAATAYEPASALYIMDANGENLFTVIDGFDAIGSPAWSPDGKRIAFHGFLKSSNMLEIYTINVDGTNLTNLTNNPSVDARPNWSPDGRSIAFESDRDYRLGVPSSQPFNFEIYVMDANGSNVKRLTFNDNQANSVAPKWSPDGQWILFLNLGIYMMDKNGEHRRLLMERNTGAGELFWWSNGKEIGFISGPTGNSIQFINIATGERHSLSVPGFPLYLAAWSPQER